MLQIHLKSFVLMSIEKETVTKINHNNIDKISSRNEVLKKKKINELNVAYL